MSYFRKSFAIIFIIISKVFLLFSASLSKISPEKNDRQDIVKRIILTIRVGKRGTKPVSKYVSNTGRNIIIDTIKRINDAMPKNFNGR